MLRGMWSIGSFALACIRVAVTTAIGKGALMALNDHGYCLECWAAGIFNVAVDATNLESTQWIIAGSFGLLCTVAWEIWRRHSQNKKQKTPRQVSDRPVDRITHDVWFLEAAQYLALRKWEFIDLHEGDNWRYAEAVLHALTHDLPQMAADGRLKTWGKYDFSGLWREVPEDDWHNYEFDPMAYLLRNPEELTATPKRDVRDLTALYGVKVSRVQVEEIWPFNDGDEG